MIFWKRVQQAINKLWGPPHCPREHRVARRHACRAARPPRHHGGLHEGEPRRALRGAGLVSLHHRVRRKGRAYEGGGEQRPDYRPARAVHPRPHPQHGRRLHPRAHCRRRHRLRGVAGQGKRRDHAARRRCHRGRRQRGRRRPPAGMSLGHPGRASRRQQTGQGRAHRMCHAYAPVRSSFFLADWWESRIFAPKRYLL